MAIENKNIESLGYRLGQTSDVERIRPLLRVCKLDVFKEEIVGGVETSYLMAMTAAGGVAASVGWTRYVDDRAVIHSLAVAPSSRGVGLGASLLASSMRHLREQYKIQAVYVGVSGIAGYFKRLGFVGLQSATLPTSISGHPTFDDDVASRLVRPYGVERHGLDKSAFCLIHNTTSDATLPEGSVFWFRQSGAVMEAQYRGGTVVRGSLLGAMKGEALEFVWQSCTRDGELKQGHGEIVIDLLDDGRREMREKIGKDPGELLLREL